MKLVIAEKPSTARAIREVIGREYEVTNAFGHILELAEPDDYLPPDVPVNPRTGKKIWRVQDLPILPGVWKQVPKPEAEDQLKKIGELLRKADLVVHAGDPDREGQLLIDEILDHFGYRGRVERIWLSALDRTSIEKAFRELRDNREFRPLGDAAFARGKADWLTGMNFTRATTHSSGTFYSIGRVQTPTLALVVRRDRNIESFVPREFFDVRTRIRHKQGDFVVTWKPRTTDGAGFDSEGRLVDRRMAEEIRGKGNGSGKISRFGKKEQRQAASLPYSLSALQKAASAKYGLSAEEVLKTCQSLYEKKVTSYPRTDCRYLPEEQLGDAARILKSLSLSPEVRQKMDAGRRHAAWDTGKVTAHHAIVPTGEIPRGLSDKEEKVYALIAASYAALFLPDYQYLSVSIDVDLGGEIWTARGRREIDRGFRALSGVPEDEEDDEATVLPECVVGDPVTAEDPGVVPKQTKPPSRFTDGTLIDAMSNIHKFVDDPEAKKRLKETSGIGTEATRAGIIEILIDRGYIVRKGKQILSMDKGRALVGFLEKTLPDLVDPVTTAQWEDALGAVADGSGRMDEFVGHIAGIVRSHTETLIKTGKNQLPERTSSGKSSGEICPVCRGTERVFRRESRKKKGIFFWICTNRDGEGSPVHGLLSDESGRPGKPFGEKLRSPAPSGKAEKSRTSKKSPGSRAGTRSSRGSR